MKSNVGVKRLSYAVRVALLYALLGAAWILLSDYALAWIAPNSRALQIIQTYKGLFFILTTTVGLYAILRTQSATIERERQRALLQALRQKQIADLGLTALEADSPQSVAERALKQLRDQLGVTRIALGAWTSEGEPLVQASISQDGSVTREGPEFERLARLAKGRLEAPLGEISLAKLENDIDGMPAKNQEPAWLVATLGGARSWHGSAAILDPALESLPPDDVPFLRSALAVVSHAVENQVATATNRIQAEMLDAVGQAVIATDQAGRITYWNRAATALYGWEADEVIGRNTVDVTSAENMQDSAAEIMTQLQAGRAWSGEFEVRRKDGTRFPALVTDTPIQNQSGELVGIIGVSADISELRQAQLELARSERLHRLILSNISDAVFLTDVDGHFAYICPNVEIIFGYSPEEVEAMGTIGQLLPDVLALRTQAVDEGEVHNVPIRISDARSQSHDLLVNVKQVDLDGRRLLFTGRDVTERVASQQSLARFTRQLSLQHQLDVLALSGAEPLEIARVGLAGLQELAPSDGSALLGNEVAGGMARPLLSRGAFDRFPDASELIPFDELWAKPGIVPSGGSQLLIADLRQQDDLPAQLARSRELGVRSVLVNRLIAGDRMVGSLGLFRLQVEPFTQEEAQIVQEVADTMAVGLLNRQLAMEEERRLAELEAVRQASLRVASELDLHAVLDSIATSVIDLIDCYDVHIFLLKEGELEFGVARWRDSDRREPYSEPRPGGITASVAVRGERIVIDDVSKSPLFGPDHPWKQGAIAGLPLRTHNEVLGVMNVAYDGPHHFSESELRILDLLADQAAIGIANANLYQAESRQRSEMQALLGVGKQLAGRYDRQGVFDSIVQALLEIVPGAEASSLWLYDREQDRITPVAYLGYADTDLGKYEVDPSISLVGKVVREQRAMLFHHASEDPSFIQFDDERLDHVQSVFGAPILAEDQVIGALFVDSFSDPEAFVDEDRRLLEGLADQAAAAIEGARLFDQVNASRVHLQELSRELVRTQEDERRRIARELHDEIGQLLTGAKLTLEMSARETGGPGGRERSINEALELIQELLSVVREMSLNLRPSMLDDLGLLPALEWHFDRYQSSTGIQVDFEQQGIEDARFPSELEITAYRVIQESLTNVARHAQVDRARVHVWLEDENLSLEIEDHGVGFNYEQALQVASARGLSGMRERIELLGGRFFVRSGPEEGTLVRAELPIEGYLERRSGRRSSG